MNGLERVFREVRRYNRKVEDSGDIRSGRQMRGVPMMQFSDEPRAGWAWISGAPDGFEIAGVDENGYRHKAPVFKRDRIYIEWDKRGAVTYARRASDGTVIEGLNRPNSFGLRPVADCVLAMLRDEL